MAGHSPGKPAPKSDRKNAKNKVLALELKEELKDYESPEVVGTNLQREIDSGQHVLPDESAE